MSRGWSRTLLIALIALGTVLVLLFSTQGWLTLLFVLTATSAAFSWSARRVFVLCAVQTLLVVVTSLVGGWPLVDLVVGATISGVSQALVALVVFTARDAADARRELAVAHAELRSTSALVEMTTREAERLRISRDLHDLLGHHLTALSLELEVAAHLTDGELGNDHVGRARSIAEDLLGTVRAAVGRMRTDPPHLESALRDLAASIPGLDVSVDVRGPLELRVEQTLTILRCLQEAITNTVRHSGARASRISVTGRVDRVDVAVTDDGGGTVRVVPGHGLTGMRERFEELGGSLQVRSRPGAGFTVTGVLPVCS